MTELTSKELQNIKALHVATKMPIYIYSVYFRLLMAYNSAKRYDVSYDFSNLGEDRARVLDNIWYEYGMFGEIFIFVRYKDVFISVGPFLTSRMKTEEMNALKNSAKMKSQSAAEREKWLDYYEKLPSYALGDVRDFVILLGAALNIDLEQVYSDRLHAQVYKNEIQIKRNYSKRTVFQEIEAEKYAFYYENKILDLVSNGDLDALRQGVAEIGCSVIPSRHRDSLRTEKNYTIVILEKLYALAVQVGMDVTDTIRLREFYINKLEQQDKLADVLAVRDSAIIHFTKELHGLANSTYSPFVLSVIQYINLKICEPYKISDFAKHFFVSEGTLRRQFKNELNMSITEYINQRKISVSKIFLSSGMPISECAKRLGFFDSSHFYRTFKKYEGVTPKQFLLGSAQNTSDETEYNK